MTYRNKRNFMQFSLGVVVVVVGLLLSPAQVFASGAPAEEGAATQEGSVEVQDNSKERMPEFSVPKLDLSVGGIPSLDGLKNPVSPEEGVLERRPMQAAEFQVHTVLHAGDFRVTSSGCVPVRRLDGFKVEHFPSTIEPFSTCVRLSASRPVIARIEARILDGETSVLADASGEISFQTGDQLDYIIEWEGFRAREKALYDLIISLEGSEVGRYQIEVSE